MRQGVEDMFSTKQANSMDKGVLRRLSSKKLGFPIAQTPTEVAILKKYARRVKPPEIIVEIGTRNGGSALVLAMNSMCQVVTIDILADPRLSEEDAARYGYKHINVPLKKHWARFAGGSRIEQVTCPSTKYSHPCSRGVGLVFIDGGHEYEECKGDWLHFYDLVSPGGYILLHDYESFPGVTKFVDEDIALPMIDRGDSIVVFQKESAE
jgi:cephalosporin hydroxylase